MVTRQEFVYWEKIKDKVCEKTEKDGSTSSLVYQYTCGSLTHIITIKELDFNNIGNHISLDRMDFQIFF